MRRVHGAALRRAVGVALVATAVVTLSGCGLFDRGGSNSDAVSVFSVKPGDCFTAPPKVQAELSSLTRVACTKPHAQEAYASVDYQAKQGQTSSGFPGPELLTGYAQGICAQEFATYVGVDYRDSSLFFTYLMPSARSWEQGKDRKITCFVTTAGEPLTSSVKGTKR